MDLDISSFSYVKNIGEPRAYFKGIYPVVIAEVSSEHWLVRSWRPMLMVMMMAFLALAGFVVPVAELLMGPIRFEPRWNALPPELWTLLSVGMGGYIGGRSLEKIADRVWGTAGAGSSGKR